MAFDLEMMNKGLGLVHELDLDLLNLDLELLLGMEQLVPLKLMDQ
jgi:hypothetical protein